TGKKISGITRGSMEVLLQYGWPGNIRELMNVIEYAFVLCPGGMIEPKHLPQHLRGEPVPVRRQQGTPVNSYQDARRRQLVEALETAGGNQTKAAGILGVSRVTVWKWMTRYGIRLGARVQAGNEGAPGQRENP
ncbi:MAG: AAA-type ATPase lid domain-containing protein, partial [Desulfobulbaceae bacterium]